MSEQANRIDNEPEILHGTGLPSVNYSFVNPFTTCKTDIIFYNTL